MNTQGLINSAREEADDKASPPLWSDSYLVQLAAEAEMEAARRARLLKDASTAAVCSYAVSQGDQYITLDPRVIFIREAKIASKTLPLWRVHKADIDMMFSDWDNTVNLGDVTRFIVDKETGKVWFDGQFPTSDTVRLLVIREPLLPLSVPTVAIGSSVVHNEGGLGVLTITYGVPGVAGNSLTFAVVGTTGAGHENRAASVAWDGTTLTLTLGTDGAGAYSATKNTFAAVATLIAAVVGNPFTAINSSDATDYFTGTSSTAFTNGAALSGTTTNPEIAARYHNGLVNWMLFRMFSKQDAETNDPKKAANALERFEEEFGKKSAAIDEKYIEDNYGYDGYDGVF